MKNKILVILFSINIVLAGEKAFYEQTFDAEMGAIFLPVQMQDRECMFLFDTGTSFVVLDKSFSHLLGEPLSTEEAEAHLGVKLSNEAIITPNGQISLELYKSVPLKLGRLQVANRFPYLLADLKPLWPLSGVEFCGILGSSFLHQFRWDINFDTGRVKAYIGTSAYDGRYDDMMDIGWNRANIPNLDLSLSGKDISFDIDTGDIGSGRLDKKNISYLSKVGAISHLYQREVFTVSGRSMHDEFRLKKLHVNSHDYPNLVFQESQQNALGMSFLKRHNLVLDFPFNRLYLKHHKDYFLKEELDKSGLELILKDNKIIVFNIRPLAGALTKGMQVGDEIIAIDATENLNLYKIRAAFRKEAGKVVSVQVKRENRVHKIRVVLGKDPLE